MMLPHIGQEMTGEQDMRPTDTANDRQVELYT